MPEQALMTKTVNASNPGNSLSHNHHGDNKAEQINIIKADNVNMGGFKNDNTPYLVEKLEDKNKEILELKLKLQRLEMDQ